MVGGVTAAYDLKEGISRDPIGSPWLQVILGKDGKLLPLSRAPSPPAELGVGPDLYKYVYNSPIDNVDPTGLVPEPGCVAGCQRDKEWRDHVIEFGGLLGGAACLTYGLPFSPWCGAGVFSVTMGALHASQAEYDDCVKGCEPEPCPYNNK